MLICGVMISCGIRQIYGFPHGDNEPSQAAFDSVMKSYPHGSTWTMASLVAEGTHNQKGSIAFLKRNGFVQFGPVAKNRRTPPYGNPIMLLIRTEDGSNPAAGAMPPISNFYQKKREFKTINK